MILTMALVALAFMAALVVWRGSSTRLSYRPTEHPSVPPRADIPRLVEHIRTAAMSGEDCSSVMKQFYLAACYWHGIDEGMNSEQAYTIARDAVMNTNLSVELVNG